MPVSVAPQAVPGSPLSPAPASPPTIAVGQMSGPVPADVRELMRNEVRGQLRRYGRVSLVDGEGAATAIYVVDGRISRLDVSHRRSEAEATAHVELVLSRPPRGILMVAQGEAVVQKHHRYLHARTRDEMLTEAVEHAVGTAHENLVAFLARGDAP